MHRSFSDRMLQRQSSDKTPTFRSNLSFRHTRREWVRYKNLWLLFTCHLLICHIAYIISYLIVFSYLINRSTTSDRQSYINEFIYLFRLCLNLILNIAIYKRIIAFLALNYLFIISFIIVFSLIKSIHWNYVFLWGREI